jgi:dienelactone hydrolase
MRTVVFSGLAIATLALGCSSNPTAPADAGADSNPTIPPLEPAVACADAIDSVYGDPGTLPPEKGAIVRCATDKTIAKADLEAQAKTDGYSGKAFTSGAKVYRISYRTERGDKGSSPAIGSAAVYLPDTPRAAGLPVVVLARGSRGQGPKCAASKMDPAADAVNPDLRRLVYPIVGAGYAAIVPDLAGYANFGAPNNPPSVYAGAADTGKSTLDGGRALKKLVPSLSDKVVLVGHSQGGHTALASLALSDSYGTAGPIVGAATYAPLWISQRSWGAVALPFVAKDYPIDTTVAAVSIWYNYTHAEALDGPGEGKKLFAPGAQAAIEKFVNETCWSSGPYAELTPLGTNPSDLYDPTWRSAVASAAAGIGDCGGNATCEKWIARYVEDRPHITGAAAKVPLLVLYGGMDTTIPPERMKCAVDRLVEDKANMKFCYVAGESHGGILGARADYVADWIASVALGAPAPADCPANESALAATTCATPPPND